MVTSCFDALRNAPFTYTGAFSIASRNILVLVAVGRWVCRKFTDYKLEVKLEIRDASPDIWWAIISAGPLRGDTDQHDVFIFRDLPERIPAGEASVLFDWIAHKSRGTARHASSEHKKEESSTNTAFS